MSVQATNYVWEHSKQRGGHRWVLLALADAIGHDGGCWPSIRRLAEMTQMSPRRIKTILRDLETASEISIDFRYRTDGSFKSSYYRLLFKDQPNEAPLKSLDGGSARISLPPPEGSANLALPSDARSTLGCRGHHQVVPPASPLEPSGEPSDEPLILCAEATKPPAALADVVLIFPVVGKTKEWALTKAKIAEYETTYPDLDVPFLMREARQWALDNPKRRKTADGMPKFLGGWLARSQNSGKGRKQVAASASPPRTSYEPKNWRETLRDCFGDNPVMMDIANDTRSWESLPAHIQQSVRDALARAPHSERLSA